MKSIELNGKTYELFEVDLYDSSSCEMCAFEEDSEACVSREAVVCFCDTGNPVTSYAWKESLINEKEVRG